MYVLVKFKSIANDSVIIYDEIIETIVKLNDKLTILTKKVTCTIENFYFALAFLFIAI